MQTKFIFFLLISVLAGSLVWLSSCKHVPEVLPSTRPCNPDTVYFQTQVLPILISNCAMSGCHDANSHKEGVNLSTYSKVMSTGGVKAGKPNDSDLYKEIIDGKMPPNGSLSASDTELIRKWIAQGALNLSCVEGCDSTNVTYTNTISPIIVSQCKGCHSGSTPSAGIDLSTYDGVKTIALNGTLYGSVSHATGYKAMPQGGSKLSDCQITAIDKWVKMGAPQN